MSVSHREFDPLFNNHFILDVGVLAGTSLLFCVEWGDTVDYIIVSYLITLPCPEMEALAFGFKGIIWLCLFL